MESINYDPERKLDRSQMEELATNKYLEKGLNVIFVGASGCGKTWLSNALGVHACRDRKTVIVHSPAGTVFQIRRNADPRKI